MDKELNQLNRMASQYFLENVITDNGGDPERKRVLELNEALRKDSDLGGVPGDWGYVALNIPPLDHAVLMLRYPDLASPDPEIVHKALMKFMASPESEPYKVRRNDGKTLAQIRRS